MTPEQSRAARGLLDWTQTDLAKKAGRDLSTVSYFEKERRGVSDDVIADLRAALERGGVEFIEQGRGKGPGVRLKRPVMRQVALDV